MTASTLIVPLDGMARALDALPVARVMAELEGATLRFVHVTRSTSDGAPAGMLERLGLDLAALKGSVLDTCVGEPAECIVRQAQATGCQGIVMSMRTVASPTGPALAGTALSVLQQAQCPVVFVPGDRGDRAWSLRRILLPHDGTPATTAAIRSAARLAHQAGADLAVLHIASTGPVHLAEPGSLTVPRYVDQPQHEWPAWAGEFVERLASIAPIEALHVHLSVTHGDPGTEIVHFAAERGADLIVVDWQGVWAGEHAAALKGVLAAAPCPVMVLRG